MADTKTSAHLGTGRRKTAVARVRLATGTGKIVVNGRAFDNYFPAESLRMVAAQPLVATGTTDKSDIRSLLAAGVRMVRPARFVMAWRGRYSQPIQTCGPL